MIIKFDGVDGCGKSTLAAAVVERLKRRRFTVAEVSEFSSPMNFVEGLEQPTPMASMQIREAVLDPGFDCDDIERQLLFHFVSRRKNRVEIPALHSYNDFVVVDRSTLSNYAYAQALDPELGVFSSLVTLETADLIFWLDTPIVVCMTRIGNRTPDAVERKGRAYLERVRELFEQRVGELPNAHYLDGRLAVDRLAEQAISIIDAGSKV